MTTPIQNQFPIQYGWPQGFSGGFFATTTALNTNATWVAYSFLPDLNKTLNSVRIYASALTGTPTNANDFTCGIYSDTGAGKPNANISGGSDQSINATPGALGWFQFDGFTAALTAGTLYWIVFKNPNTTDASASTIFPTYQHWTGSLTFNIGGKSNLQTGVRTTSTNSGGAWGSIAAGITPSMSLIFSDTTYYGMPIQTNAADTTKIFNNGSASIEVGVKLTTPANGQMNIKAVSWYISTATTFVGPAIVKIYAGSSTSACTLLAQSQTVATGNITAVEPAMFYFTSPVTLSANTVYRVVLADTASTGTTSKFLELLNVTFDSAIAGLSALTPFNGTMVKTTTPSGTSTPGNSPLTAFTDSSFGEVIPVALFLDTNGEFTSTGGGGGGTPVLRSAIIEGLGAL